MSTLLKVSEAASIGLHAEILLASDGTRLWSTRELAEGLRVSRAHLVKVMQQLTRQGLVEAVRGPKGGYRLARPSDQTTLLEIYEAIEGPLEPVGCLLEKPICNGRCCIMGDLLRQVNGIRDELAAKTLASAVAALNQSE